MKISKQKINKSLLLAKIKFEPTPIAETSFHYGASIFSGSLAVFNKERGEPASGGFAAFFNNFKFSLAAFNSVFAKRIKKI